jgi:hypothetical protein
MMYFLPGNVGRDAKGWRVKEVVGCACSSRKTDNLQIPGKRECGPKLKSH